MTAQPHIPRPSIDREAILTHLHAAQHRRTPVAIWTAIEDIPVLLAEIQRLDALLSRARWDFADLLAAGRATLDADRDGEPDPLSYLRDEVSAHRPWPPADGDGRDR
ncbi:MAG TPA: hypothetical protein VFB74_11560 [Kribbellaceae bacterium]|nr:hypothetical protein [Kribbellaceae bacterium]